MKKKEKEEESSNELNFISEIISEIFYEKEIEKEDGSSIDHKVFKIKYAFKELNFI